MRFVVCACLALCGLPVLAHPLPDVPVRARFSVDGRAVIQVEVDPRCFEADPLNTPYLLKRELDRMSQTERQELEGRAAALITETLRFHFEPTVRTPEFEYSFTTHGGKPLDVDADVPVMVMAQWTFELSADTSGYRVEALPTGRLSVLFLNVKNGVEERKHVLFPGETSYRLDL